LSPRLSLNAAREPFFEILVTPVFIIG